MISTHIYLNLNLESKTVALTLIMEWWLPTAGKVEDWGDLVK